MLFASTGGAGHVTPLLPVADACRRAGHDVRLLGPPNLADTARRAGLGFVPGADADPAEIGPVWERIGRAPREEARRLAVGAIFATANVRAMLPAARASVRTWRPDVVVRESGEFSSAVAAEEAGVPHVQVAVTLRSTHERIARTAAEAVDAWRPGLTARIAAAPYLTAFPPTLDPAPASVHRIAAPRPVPAPLPDHWPGDDRPLVYVTFGSVAAGVPFAAPVFDAALAAVADLPARVLLTTGVPGTAHRSPGRHVHVTSWVPQDDVLARADLVVCHGGSGTTLGALAAGVPLVVVPLFADQPDNAERVSAAGAGVTVTPRDPDALPGAVDPDDLRRAVLDVLADPGPAAAARALAAEIAASPPADRAVGVITSAAVAERLSWA